MKNFEIEQKLRMWGAKGLYHGFWPMLEILEQMKKGVPFRVALQVTAEKWEGSVPVMRRRINILLLCMKREKTEEYIAAFGDAGDLKPKEMMERMAAMLPGGYIQ